MSQQAALLKFGHPVEGGGPLPRPVCSHCNLGHVHFEDPTETEHGASKADWDHPAWEPHWITGTFTTVGTCENSACGYKVAASGSYRVDHSEDNPGYDYQGDTYSSYYTFRNFTPPLTLMNLPAATPTEIQDGVERASAVLFADPGLAATALRLVVEQFLEAEGFPSQKPTGGFVSLDERIKKWKAAKAGREEVGNFLLAAKWIGNAGTHSLATMTVADVLGAVTILNEAFHTLFVRPEIDSNVQAINAAKGLTPPPSVP